MVNVVGKDDNIYKRITCRKCASILQYLPTDLKGRTSKDYGGGNDYVEFVVCPTCSNEVVTLHI